MKILIVNDDVDVALSWSCIFPMETDEIDIATELQHAFAFVAQTRYDLVITSLGLSSCDDASVLLLLGSIRKRSGAKRIVVVAPPDCTPELRDEAYRVGAELVLTPPVSLQHIAAAVASNRENPQRSPSK